MNAVTQHPRSRLRSSAGLGPQRGAATVEFALTIGLSLALMVAIIEFAVAMYNQGVLVHATRLGTREASLFWVDPAQITQDSDPRNDQRIHRDTVVNGVRDWTHRFVVSSTSDVTDDPLFRLPQETLFLNGETVMAETPVVATRDEVRIDSEFQFRGPVTSVLSGTFNYTQSARADMRVE